MNKTTEALKLAEEALESCNSGKWSMSFDEIDVERALAAIREALADHPMDYDQGFVDGVEAQLAEPVKQEPVAFRVHPFDYGVGHEGVYAMTMRLEQVEAWKRKGWVVEPLYAAPVSAKREWVDLTDDEIWETVKNWNLKERVEGNYSLTRAVIAKFKEKNK